MHHYSWCIVQEIISVMEQVPPNCWILLSGGSKLLSLGDADRLENMLATGPSVFLLSSGLQAWRNDLHAMQFACAIWTSIWDKEKMFDEITEFESSMLNLTSWVSDTIRSHLNIVARKTHKYSHRAVNNSFRDCMNNRWRNEYVNVSLMLLRNISEELHEKCPLHVRFHYARDKCIASAQYEYPDIIDPEDSCDGDLKNRYAVIIYLTESGHEFELALKGTSSFMSSFHSSDKFQDIVVATGNLSNWEDSRRQTFLEHLVWWNSSVSGRLLHLIPPTINKDDVAHKMGKHNCCGWSEFQKLGVFNLIQYESILVIDADVRFYEPISSLFKCHTRFDFLSTEDPQVALQGGFYWLRPSKQIFYKMRQMLRTPGLFETYSGWNNSGPIFNQKRADVDRRRNGKNLQSFAITTPQGFLFYFWYIYKHNLRAAQLSVCTYNFRLNDVSSRVQFVCVKHFGTLWERGIDHVRPKVTHGCANHILNIKSMKRSTS